MGKISLSIFTSPPTKLENVRDLGVFGKTDRLGGVGFSRSIQGQDQHAGQRQFQCIEEVLHVGTFQVWILTKTKR